MSLADALISYAQSGGKDSSSLYRALAQPRRTGPQPSYSAQSRPRPSGDGEGGGEGGPTMPAEHLSKMLVLPTGWKGTHTTSGLGWGNMTAEDIMARAGTQVGAPEPGVVKYFHPTGAQGGGSMLFDPDAPGGDYWLGHIAQGLPAGTRIKRRGQRIAYVSSDHPAPHVHIDRR